MRTLIYRADHQGYSKTYHMFQTDSSMTVAEMRELSFTPSGAGRFSTSVGTFVSLLCEKAFVKLGDEVSAPIEDFGDIEIVLGAEGNY